MAFRVIHTEQKRMKKRNSDIADKWVLGDFGKDLKNFTLSLFHSRLLSVNGSLVFQHQSKSFFCGSLHPQSLNLKGPFIRNVCVCVKFNVCTII